MKSPTHRGIISLAAAAGNLILIDARLSPRLSLYSISPELTSILVAVVTVGVTLAALMTGLFAWLHQDMGILRQEVGERIGQLESRIDQRFDRLENRLAVVEHGQAKLEGLREAITGRRAAS